MEIVWIETPKTCKECKHYDPRRKRCTLKECRYRAKRQTILHNYASGAANSGADSMDMREQRINYVSR